jgi:hypothetical protein
MRCVDVQRSLRGLPDCGPEPPEVQEHLAQCVDCTTVLKNYVLLRAALEELPAPAVPDGFELSLRRRLKAEATRCDGEATRGDGEAAGGDGEVDGELDGELGGERDGDSELIRPSRRWRLPALAAAAILVVAAGAWLLLRSTGSDPVVSYHRLRLAARTARPCPGVFEVRLPRGTRLVPEAGDALVRGGTLRWRSRLEAGISTFDLPLVTRADDDDAPLPAVSARMTVEGRTYTATVRLVRGQHAQHAQHAQRARSASPVGAGQVMLALSSSSSSSPREEVRP